MFLTWVRLWLFSRNPKVLRGAISPSPWHLAAIATSLQCLIADEEMNDGQGEYYEEGLKRFVDKHTTEGDEYEG